MDKRLVLGILLVVMLNFSFGLVLAEYTADCCAKAIDENLPLYVVCSIPENNDCLETDEIITACYDNAIDQYDPQICEAVCCCNSLNAQESTISAIGVCNADLTSNSLEYTSDLTACRTFCSYGEVPPPPPPENLVTMTIHTTYGNPLINLGGANVALSIDGVIASQTDTSGIITFSFLPQDSPFQVSVTHNYCEDALTTVDSWTIENMENEDVLGITLTCDFPEDQCVESYDFGAWGPCYLPIDQDHYVKTRTWTYADDNTCQLIPPSFQLIQYCDEETTCDGTQLDIGEMCDGTNFIDNRNTCEDWGYITPDDVEGLACTSTCTVDVSQCEGQCGNACDSIAKCDCEICIDNPLCSYGENPVCSVWLGQTEAIDTLDIEPESTPLALQYYEGTRDVSVYWNFGGELGCNKETMVNSFTVKICEEDPANHNTCRPETPIKEFSLPKETLSQKFDDILEKNYDPEQTRYCYNICANMRDTRTICAYDEEWACSDSGDQICLDTREPGRNCEQEGDHELVVGCDSRTLRYDEFDTCDPNTVPGEICVETQYVEGSTNPANQGAMCKEVGACEQCGGLFGMFSELFTGANGLSVMYLGNQQSCSNLEAQNICYVTSSLTDLFPEEGDYSIYHDIMSSKDFYASCEYVNDCYDYKIQSSCEQNTCRIINNSIDVCEWSWFNEELGIGVCNPTNEELEDCTKCDIDSPLGFCTSDMCEDYGNCYYVENENVEQQILSTTHDVVQGFGSSKIPTCVHARDMACALYNDEDSCEGGTESSIDVNVIYENNELKYNGGSLEQTSFSNDTFNFGDCVWLEEDNRCIKNSDGFSTFNNGNRDDCEVENPNDLDCYRDVSPPITTLSLREPEQVQQIQTEGSLNMPIYGKNEINNIQFSVSDNYFVENLDARFSLTYVVDDIYDYYNHMADEENDFMLYIPNNGADEIIDNPLSPNFPRISMTPDGIIPFEADTHGVHILRYFSVDKALNLEPIQEAEIFIDAMPPVVTLTHSISSFKIDEDRWLSNLSISASWDEDAYVTARLTSGNGAFSFPVGNVEVYGRSFLTLYPFLQDDIYTLSLYKTDDYLNAITDEYEIIVEGDLSINSPYPRGLKVRSIPDTQIISINTSLPGVCKFDTNYNNRLYESANYDFIPSNGGLHHSFLINESFASEQGWTWPLSNGSYYFFPSCEFEDGNITEDSRADTIFFHIDGASPQTTLYRLDGTEFEFEPVYTAGLTLNISCSDENNLNILSPFGCDYTVVCGRDDANTDGYDELEQDDCDMYYNVFLGSEFEDENMVQLGFNAQDHNLMVLWYYSVDNGGNKEEIKTARLPIRDVEFNLPVFDIIS